MNDSIGFSIQTWDNHWQSLPETEKWDLIDLSSPWEDEEFTKIRTLLIVIHSLSKTKKIEPLKEIRSYMTSKWGHKNKNEMKSDQESLLYDILDAAKTYGTPLDVYDSLTYMGDYYFEYVYKSEGYKNLEARDSKKALYYYRQAYLMMDSCYQEYVQKRQPIEGELEMYFGGNCYMLILLLIKDAQLAESVRIEEEILPKGFLDYRKEIILLKFQLLRLEKRIELWKMGGEDSTLEGEIDYLAKTQPAYAANFYKSIGNIYYNRENFIKAKSIFEKALLYCPTLGGITLKLKKINKSLNNNWHQVTIIVRGYALSQ